ncbi:MAG: hypothetical protein DRO95_05595 [Candidatus Altiarchaeales archaeon]|nr:MAG: hypothetical protein DRO95_05595 [Candidatus Altiarchaeales archaeon]
MINIENMIENSFWKDILYEIISQMDPWDIDIVELATRYSDRIERMREMNFKIPANVILVSSVLLRMKAEITIRDNFLTIPSESEFDFGEDFQEFMEFEGIAISDDVHVNYTGDHAEDKTSVRKENNRRSISISIVPRRVPRRRVTAIELIAAIQEVLEDKRIKEKLRKSRERVMEIKVVRDITELVEEVYERVMGILMNNNKKMIRFSDILNGNGTSKEEKREEIVRTFISLLYLSNEQKLKLEQKRLYDEIFIMPYKSHSS